MNCYNCGNPVNESDKMCPNCGAFQSTIKQETVPAKEILKETSEEKKNANRLCLLSVLLLIIPTIILTFVDILNFKKGLLVAIFKSINPIIDLLSLLLTIVVRIKYPNNVFGKVLMWFFIITIGGGLLLAIVFMLSCAIACRNTDTSGCS